MTGYSLIPPVCLPEKIGLYVSTRHCEEERGLLDVTFELSLAGPHPRAYGTPNVTKIGLTVERSTDTLERPTTAKL